MNKKEKIALKPKPDCKYCLGRGYISVIRPDLDPSIYRELRPCHCVKVVVKVEDAIGREIEQAVVEVYK